VYTNDTFPFFSLFWHICGPQRLPEDIKRRNGLWPGDNDDDSIFWFCTCNFFTENRTLLSSRQHLNSDDWRIRGKIVGTVLCCFVLLQWCRVICPHIWPLWPVLIVSCWFRLVNCFFCICLPFCSCWLFTSCYRFSFFCAKPLVGKNVSEVTNFVSSGTQKSINLLWESAVAHFSVLLESITCFISCISFRSSFLLGNIGLQLGISMIASHQSSSVTSVFRCYNLILTHCSNGGSLLL